MTSSEWTTVRFSTKCRHHGRVRVEADNAVGLHRVDQVCVDLRPERCAAVLPGTREVGNLRGDGVATLAGVVDPHRRRDEIVGIRTGDQHVRRGLRAFRLGLDVLLPCRERHFRCVGENGESCRDGCVCLDHEMSIARINIMRCLFVGTATYRRGAEPSPSFPKMPETRPAVGAEK